MSVNDYPTLDGIDPSWADITVTARVPGRPKLVLNDVKSFDTGTTLEVGEVRGASGGRVMRRTTGSEKVEASMVQYRSAFQDFLEQLAAVAPKRGNQARVGLVSFDIEIQHTPPGSVRIYMVRLKGCRYMGRGLKGAEGTDADIVEVKLNPLVIADVVDGQEVVLL